MIFRHSLAYLAAKGLPGAINFVALLIYTRMLSAEEYGKYSLVMAGATAAGLLMFQWQRRVISRWLPGEGIGAKKFLGVALSQFIVISVVTIVIGMSAGVLLGGELRYLIICATLFLVSNSWLELNLSIASADLSPRRYGNILVSKTVVSLLLGVLLVNFKMGGSAPIWGLTLAGVIAVSIFGCSPWKGVRPIWPDLVLFRRHLSYGLPLAFTLALGWVVDGSGRVFVGMQIGAQAAGQYAAAYDLTQNSLMILLSIVQVPAFALVFSTLEKKGEKQASDQAKQNGELLIALALSCAAGMCVLSTNIADLVIGKEFKESTAQLLPVIAIGAALGGIKMFHFDLAFHLSKRTTGLMLCAVTTAISNFLLNMVLIPSIGVVGAAWATVGSYGIGLILSAFLGRSEFPMPAVGPLLGKGSVVAAVSAATAYAAKIIFEPQMSQLIFGVLGGIFGAIVASYALNLSGIRKFVSLKIGEKRLNLR